MPSSVPFKITLHFGLASILLTEALSIAKNNVCFLSSFLAIVIETCKDMVTMFKGVEVEKENDIIRFKYLSRIESEEMVLS